MYSHNKNSVRTKSKAAAHSVHQKKESHRSTAAAYRHIQNDSPLKSAGTPPQLEKTEPQSVAHRLNLSPLQESPVIQRWSIAMIDEERKRLKKTDKVFGGAIALHHIISRDQLSGMVKVVNILATLSGGDAKKWRETVGAAREFLGSVTTAAKTSFGKDYSEFNKQTKGDQDKILHNLPVNLIAGPKELLGDPGTSFDPGTVSGNKSDDNVDHRIVDERSDFLGRMVLAFDKLEAARLENSDDDAAKALADMGKSLMAAVKSLEYPANVQDIDPDLWLKHEGRFSKKQPGIYRDETVGTKLFTAARQAPAPIPTGPFNITAAAVNGKNIRLVLSTDAIDHIYKRHSYAYFDFDQIKLRNTFWPVDMSSDAIYDDIKGKAAQLHRGIQAKYADTDPLDLYGVSLKLQLPGMYVIGGIDAEFDDEDDDVDYGAPEDFVINVETIAPEGLDQYTAGVLEEIKTDFM